MQAVAPLGGVLRRNLAAAAMAAAAASRHGAGATGIIAVGRVAVASGVCPARLQQAGFRQRRRQQAPAASGFLLRASRAGQLRAPRQVCRRRRHVRSLDCSLVTAAARRGAGAGPQHVGEVAQRGPSRPQKAALGGKSRARPRKRCRSAAAAESVTRRPPLQLRQATLQRNVARRQRRRSTGLGCQAWAAAGAGSSVRRQLYSGQQRCAVGRGRWRLFTTRVLEAEACSTG